MCHIPPVTCQLPPVSCHLITTFFQLHMLWKFQEVWWRFGYIQSWIFVFHKFVFTKWQFLCLQLKEEIKPVGRWKGPKFSIGHKGTEVQKFLIETLVFVLALMLNIEPQGSLGRISWGYPLQKTDMGAPIQGDPPTLMETSDENENNVEYCESLVGSSWC